METENPVKVDYAVIKEKIIKTDEILKMYFEKNHKLKKCTQTNEELKCQHDRLLLDNERNLNNLKCVKSEKGKLELKYHEISNQLLELEKKYNQQVVESQSCIKSLEDELTLQKELKRMCVSPIKNKENRNSKGDKKIIEELEIKFKDIQIYHKNENNKLSRDIEVLEEKLSKVEDEKKRDFKELATVKMNFQQLQIQMENKLKTHTLTCEQKNKEIQELKLALSVTNDMKQRVRFLESENQRLVTENSIKSTNLEETKSENTEDTKTAKKIHIISDIKICRESDMDCSNIFTEMINIPRALSPLRSPVRTELSHDLRSEVHDKKPENKSKDHLVSRRIERDKSYKKLIERKRALKNNKILKPKHKQQDSVLKALQILKKSKLNFTITNKKSSLEPNTLKCSNCKDKDCNTNSPLVWLKNQLKHDILNKLADLVTDNLKRIVKENESDHLSSKRNKDILTMNNLFIKKFREELLPDDICSEVSSPSYLNNLSQLSSSIDPHSAPISRNESQNSFISNKKIGTKTQLSNDLNYRNRHESVKKCQQWHTEEPLILLEKNCKKDIQKIEDDNYLLKSQEKSVHKGENCVLNNICPENEILINSYDSDNKNEVTNTNVVKNVKDDKPIEHFHIDSILNGNNSSDPIGKKCPNEKLFTDDVNILNPDNGRETLSKNEEDLNSNNSVTDRIRNSQRIQELLQKLPEESEKECQREKIINTDRCIDKETLSKDISNLNNCLDIHSDHTVLTISENTVKNSLDTETIVDNLIDEENCSREELFTDNVLNSKETLSKDEKDSVTDRINNRHRIQELLQKLPEESDNLIKFKDPIGKEYQREKIIIADKCINKNIHKETPNSLENNRFKTNNDESVKKLQQWHTKEPSTLLEKNSKKDIQKRYSNYLLEVKEKSVNQNLKKSDDFDNKNEVINTNVVKNLKDNEPINPILNGSNSLDPNGEKCSKEKLFTDDVNISNPDNDTLSKDEEDLNSSNSVKDRIRNSQRIQKLLQKLPEESDKECQREKIINTDRCIDKETLSKDIQNIPNLNNCLDIHSDHTVLTISENTVKNSLDTETIVDNLIDEENCSREELFTDNVLNRKETLSKDEEDSVTNRINNSQRIQELLQKLPEESDNLIKFKDPIGKEYQREKIIIADKCINKNIHKETPNSLENKRFKTNNDKNPYESVKKLQQWHTKEPSTLLEKNNKKDIQKRYSNYLLEVKEKSVNQNLKKSDDFNNKNEVINTNVVKNLKDNEPINPILNGSNSLDPNEKKCSKEKLFTDDVNISNPDNDTLSKDEEDLNSSNSVTDRIRNSQRIQELLQKLPEESDKECQREKIINTDRCIDKETLSKDIQNIPNLNNCLDIHSDHTVLTTSENTVKNSLDTETIVDNLIDEENCLREELFTDNVPNSKETLSKDEKDSVTDRINNRHRIQELLQKLPEESDNLIKFKDPIGKEYQREKIIIADKCINKNIHKETPNSLENKRFKTNNDKNPYESVKKCQQWHTKEPSTLLEKNSKKDIQKRYSNYLLEVKEKSVNQNLKKSDDFDNKNEVINTNVVKNLKDNEPINPILNGSNSLDPNEKKCSKEKLFTDDVNISNPDNDTLSKDEEDLNSSNSVTDRIRNSQRIQELLQKLPEESDKECQREKIINTDRCIDKETLSKDTQNIPNLNNCLDIHSDHTVLTTSENTVKNSIVDNLIDEENCYTEDLINDRDNLDISLNTQKCINNILNDEQNLNKQIDLFLNSSQFEVNYLPETSTSSINDLVREPDNVNLVEEELIENSTNETIVQNKAINVNFDKKNNQVVGENASKEINVISNSSSSNKSENTEIVNNVQEDFSDISSMEIITSQSKENYNNKTLERIINSPQHVDTNRTVKNFVNKILVNTDIVPPSLFEKQTNQSQKESHIIVEKCDENNLSSKRTIVKDKDTVNKEVSKEKFKNMQSNKLPSHSPNLAPSFEKNENLVNKVEPKEEFDNKKLKTTDIMQSNILPPYSHIIIENSDENYLLRFEEPLCPASPDRNDDEIITSSPKIIPLEKVENVDPIQDDLFKRENNENVEKKKDILKPMRLRNRDKSKITTISSEQLGINLRPRGRISGNDIVDYIYKLENKSFEEPLCPASPDRNGDEIITSSPKIIPLKKVENDHDYYDTFDPIQDDSFKRENNEIGDKKKDNLKPMRLRNSSEQLGINLRPRGKTYRRCTSSCCINNEKPFSPPLNSKNTKKRTRQSSESSNTDICSEIQIDTTKRTLSKSRKCSKLDETFCTTETEQDSTQYDNSKEIKNEELKPKKPVRQKPVKKLTKLQSSVMKQMKMKQKMSMKPKVYLDDTISDCDLRINEKPMVTNEKIKIDNLDDCDVRIKGENNHILNENSPLIDCNILTTNGTTCTVNKNGNEQRKKFLKSQRKKLGNTEPKNNCDLLSQIMGEMDKVKVENDYAQKPPLNH